MNSRLAGVHAASASSFIMIVMFAPGAFFSHGNWWLGVFLLIIQMVASNSHKLISNLRQTGKWYLVYILMADILGVITYVFKNYYPEEEVSISLFYTLILLILMVSKGRFYRLDDKQNVYPVKTGKR